VVAAFAASAAGVLPGVAITATTRGLDITASAKRSVANKAARAEAVVQRWNDQLTLGRDVLWLPTIRAALLAGRMGLEGIVSKRLSAPYRAGCSRDWLKIKNSESPAMVRAWEGGF
jgi:hypothetical protein